MPSGISSTTVLLVSSSKSTSYSASARIAFIVSTALSSFFLSKSHGQRGSSAAHRFILENFRARRVDEMNVRGFVS